MIGMTMQLGQLAELVKGRLIGDPALPVCGANPPAEALAGEVTLLDDANRHGILRDCQAVAVITAKELPINSMGQILVDRPHRAFAQAVAWFRPPIEGTWSSEGIDPTAMIDPTAWVHGRATIGAGVKIGARTKILPGTVILPKAEIGEDCVIHANVTLYEYSRIADRVVIHAGAVIGAHGFGYHMDSGHHVAAAQLGYVQIDSDVEIGACATIDRGTYGATHIGEGTKIDNQVMIAHNCKIGRHNLICSQVGIAGSCRTGDYVVLAGQVGLKDHIILGDHVIVGAQAGVMEHCLERDVYLGSPATTQREQMQIMAVQRRLPEMRREVKQLRRDIDQLQQSVDQKRVA
jgi:UDP-3-O-[3-hydroxymyristoyl] glucosamine N-acyltransferase